MHRSTEPRFDLEGVARPLSERGRVAPPSGLATVEPSSAPAGAERSRGAAGDAARAGPLAEGRGRRLVRRRRLGVAVGIAVGVACASLGVAMARPPRRRRWARVFR